jgi:hypothetical protein
MWLNGRSLTELGNVIANRSGVQFENMTLYVQAGDLGRPIPLLTDLPLTDDPIIILAFTVDSPGENHINTLLIESQVWKVPVKHMMPTKGWRNSIQFEPCIRIST